MKIVSLILLLMISIVVSSCGGNKQFVDRFGKKCNKVPKWATKLPKKSGMMYAVGFAMPDTYAERSLAAAEKKARLELARTIETKLQVNSQMIDEYIRKKGIDEQTTNRTTIVRDVVNEVSTRTVTGSKIEQVYYDNCDLMSRGEGSHYVLVSVPK